MPTASSTDMALSTLRSLAAIPTVSYHESAVAEFLKGICRDAGLDVSVDDYGNVLAARPGTNPAARGMAFVAHMDHPGFEAMSVENGKVIAEVRGGITREAIKPDVRLLVIDDDGARIPGVIATVAEDSRSIVIDVGGARITGLPRPVILDMLDIEIDGNVIHMRAMDDLGGCAAVAAAVIHAVKHPSEGTVFGLFTRAEEVGLVGARLAAKSGLLPKNTYVVSVETSHTLPGAELGGGVVIRTGDGGTTFDHEAESFLKRAASELAKTDPEFKIQRQLMSGGSCEATAFAGYGYQVTGTSFPLGNWHNGLVQKVLEPEQIHMNDFLSGVKLLGRVVALAGTALPVPAWLSGSLDKEIGRLRESID